MVYLALDIKLFFIYDYDYLNVNHNSINPHPALSVLK